MRHTMTLQPQPFRLIQAGQKRIELRLYDQKRQQLRVGDEIAFSCPSESAEPLVTRVAALHRFSNFTELYASLPLLWCGYTPETLPDASPEDMARYYSAEEQAQYGVVGIQLGFPKRDDSLLKASRFLSRVLRHRPGEAGITLDRHGWADVAQLLEGLRETHPLTLEQLEEIVRTNNKQRFSFNGDKTKIRANQGHSIPVDVELTECEPPEVLYHGTGRRNCGSILTKGLLSMKRLYVHLSGDIETAKTVGIRHGTPVVFSVMSGQMYREGVRFFRSENGVWLTGYVPPDRLRRL